MYKAMALAQLVKVPRKKGSTIAGSSTTVEEQLGFQKYAIRLLAGTTGRSAAVISEHWLQRMPFGRTLTSTFMKGNARRPVPSISNSGQQMRGPSTGIIWI
ncbi:hypothetical protein SNOG_14223 [Parastagonospora nodorum SN15]|uniref:Uncharacterized protein n=2 Tax=Phaeosphaeria nodorum (strain SN15 / ATCC MYA-4574 / FGSC 10173) TaxID=321614 RepID=Q0U259_PHANO|nr:hypothetical protein SNOG_14223 [Parastagonospora nodorum SN15]EAT78460.1 hypothetical protein SNOG_14223 [Parastagonospora nodorum SN15]